MRTAKQISDIKEQISDPYAVSNFLPIDDIAYLVNLFNSHKDSNTHPKVYKNTGPVTLDIRMYINDPVIAKILKKIKDEIGHYEITAGFFFDTNYPHIIHNDDLFQLPDNMYKAIAIPLTFNVEEPLTEFPKLCFFNQFYFHGPSKFFKGSENKPTYYNKQIYDYTDIEGLTDVAIPHETYEKLFTHLEPNWLEGLSIHSTLPCEPGSAIIFDSVRLHCSSDFRKLKIQSKLAISIFTRRTAEVVENTPIKFYQIPRA